MNYRYHIQHSEETYHHFFRVRRYQVAYESFRGGMLENIERECLGGGPHPCDVPLGDDDQAVLDNLDGSDDSPSQGRGNAAHTRSVPPDV